ncbi:uncharacterized protein LOC9648880 [Selaginella moellendorffii]|nr:uncharacterized protein LOC9648880 [Selaginella moellendorffii]|eukprot:XP_002986311.2 uncharacterized protein LOC9648880 [Selaginella moellendorffii]
MEEERTPSPPPVVIFTSSSSSHSRQDHWASSAPTHELLEGVELVWQIPSSPPRAILFIAHPGCGSPGDFFPPHRDCARCKGLPEHSAITQRAIAARYAVVAIKSAKDYWQTWPLEASQDAFNVERIVDSWKNRHGMANLPLVALGCASGGSFVSALALRIEFAALVIMISHGVTRAFQRATNRYPPTLFVHMPKDSLTAAKIEREIRALQSKGIPTEEIACLDFPVTSEIFRGLLSSHGASKLFAALVIHGVINGEGFVTSAMQTSEIRELLQRADIFGEADEDEREMVVESVNCLIRVAEARHAVTARKCSEIFDWLEQYIIRRHL